MDSPSADRTRRFQPANNLVTRDPSSANTEILYSSESAADGENAPLTKPEVDNGERDWPSGPKAIFNELSEDDADSDCTESVPDTSEDHRKNLVIIWLEANWTSMDWICMFKAMADTGTPLNVLSYAVAKKIFRGSKIDVDALPQKVAVYVTPYSEKSIWLSGPARVKVRLRNSRSRRRYLANFYVFPKGARFESLVGLNFLQKIGWYFGPAPSGRGPGTVQCRCFLATDRRGGRGLAPRSPPT